MKHNVVFSKENNPSEHKDYILSLFKKGFSVRVVYQKLLHEGIELSYNTIYKYKKELENGL